MQILVCPDKFKGSLTAKEVCKAIDKGLKSFDPSIETILLPLADGGEGTLDVLESALSIDRVALTVSDPLFRPIDAYYLRDGSRAFIEMALASGLQILNESEKNPLNTTTYGTGEMIRHALDHGAEEIFLLIGGSATNDGGIGMAEALGYEFETGTDVEFRSVGGSLADIVAINQSNRHHRIDKVQFTVLSDVKNVLLGAEGAAYIYGAQKGADGEAIEQLDYGLTNLANLLNNENENQEGSGAAGGLGYGAMSFLDAKVQSGIDTILEIVNFDENSKDVDLVITGEGKLDGQSLEGKVISGVIKVCQKEYIPIGIICGFVEEETRELLRGQVFDIQSLLTSDITLAYALENAGELTESRVLDLIQNFKTRKP
ncbi:hypothetical protein BFP97_17265 [Roseivirga sp. 4D4]|uniref:glycerate kinase n=1 Tax=Roseivirga sp. 4D4 TaxID=1889784 RepID=UPI000852A4FE|nr:glycerate kinase [Roseivirga sp. 4D4]OEK03163.1 hypothetical protein BFP97_17265 [Roseivirga sp. 4D4]